VTCCKLFNRHRRLFWALGLHSHMQETQLSVLQRQMGSPCKPPASDQVPVPSVNSLTLIPHSSHIRWFLLYNVYVLNYVDTLWGAVDIVYTAVLAWQCVLSAYVLKYKEKWKRKCDHLGVIKDSVQPTTFADNKPSLSWKIKCLT